MNDRAEQELVLLRHRWPDLQVAEPGLWALLPNQPLSDGWSATTADIAFQIPEQLPGQAPYGFWAHAVPDGTALTYLGQQPANYTFPVAPGTVPFPGTWSQFSWVLEPWEAGNTPRDGSNMLQFATSFARRFEQGA